MGPLLSVNYIYVVQKNGAIVKIYEGNEDNNFKVKNCYEWYDESVILIDNRNSNDSMSFIYDYSGVLKQIIYPVNSQLFSRPLYDIIDYDEYFISEGVNNQLNCGVNVSFYDHSEYHNGDYCIKSVFIELIKDYNQGRFDFKMLSSDNNYCTFEVVVTKYSGEKMSSTIKVDKINKSAEIVK